MSIKLTFAGACAVMVVLLVAFGLQAAPISQDTVQPAPRQLNDCQQLAEYQANLWQTQPVVAQAAAGCPQLDDCQALAEYQANQWQTQPSVAPESKPASTPAFHLQLDDCQALAEYQANLWRTVQTQ